MPWKDYWNDWKIKDYRRGVLGNIKIIFKSGMMNKMKLLAFLMLFVLPEISKAQRESYPLDWFLRDVEQDSMFGTGVHRIYKELLPGKKPASLIVAVIDSGFDTTAQMLRPVLWRNLGEIVGNGKDDDHNGYTDDIHGWNFMGTRDGDSQSRGVPEELRTYSWLLKTYKGDMRKMPQEERDLFVSLYRTYGIRKVEYERESIEAQEKLKEIKRIKKQAWFKKAYKEHMVRKATEPVLTNEEKIEMLKAGKPLPRVELDTVEKILTQERILLRTIESDKELFTIAFDIRKVIGDDPYDMNDRKYGHPYFPIASCSKHGTHVASTIGGVQEPNSGVYGIAQGVQIMLLQVVPPGGDEEDKDIALAIRYAVDNGAKVINMSFGKYTALSSTQKWIEEAMDYAAAHDVLIVRAAGNNSKNIDQVNVYPGRPSKPETQACYICVGAHGSNLRAVDKNNKLVIFSNYGKKSVDLFAPGHNIYSQVPGGYAQQSGTSMASPVCAGVAALIRMYYPSLTAAQVKDILMKTVTPCNQTCKFVRIPLKFSDMSISGGMLNGYEAMKLAEEMAK